LLLFLFGAVVFSLFDGFHTHSGTTSYPDPWVLGMAWWTPLLFGSSVCILGVAYAELHARMGATREAPAWPRIAVGVLAFALLYFMTGFWGASGGAKLGVLLGASVLLWAALDRTRRALVLMLGTAVLGCATELVLTHLGLFSYTRPDVSTVALWLPGLYTAGAVTLGPMARKL
jgi:hypothetical protein